MEFLSTLSDVKVSWLWLQTIFEFLPASRVKNKGIQILPHGKLLNNSVLVQLTSDLLRTHWSKQDHGKPSLGVGKPEVMA